MAGAGNPQDVFQGSAQALGQAGQTAANVSQFQPQSIASGISTFQNPFEQQVVQGALGDIERQRQMAINDVGAQATGAGAFGGSRQGVAEALTNEAALRQAGNIGANIRSQGFNTAAGLAGQDIANRMAGQQLNLGAAGTLGNLGNLGFGIGQQITGQQARQGAQQQALLQQLIDNARANFAGFTGSPAASTQLPLQALGTVPFGQTTTQQQQPGLLNFLSLGLGLL